MKKALFGILIAALLYALGAALAETPEIELGEYSDYVLAIFEDDEEIGLTHAEPYWAFVSNASEIRETTDALPEWDVKAPTDTGAVIRWETWDDGTGFYFHIDTYPDEPCVVEVPVTCRWAGKTASKTYTFTFVKPDSLPTGTNIPDEALLYVGKQYDLSLDFVPEGYSFGGADLFGFDIEFFFDWSDDYFNDDVEGRKAFSIVPHTAGVYPSMLSVVTGNMAIEKDITFTVEEPEIPEIELYDWNDFTLALFDDDESIGLRHAERFYNAFVLNADDIRTKTDEDPVWSVKALSDTDAVISIEPADGYPELLWFNVDRYPSKALTAQLEVTCEWAGRTATGTYTFKFVKPSSLPTGTNIPDRIDMKVGEQYDLALDFTPAGYNFGSGEEERRFGFDLPSKFFDWGSNYASRVFSITPHTAGIYPSSLHVLSSNLLIEKDVLIYVYEKNGATPYAKTLALPDDLVLIEEEAFLRTDAQRVRLPDGCKTIESRAFAECESLMLVELPDSVTSIADDAFEGSEDGLIFCCNAGSYARDYAEEHEFLVIDPGQE